MAENEMQGSAPHPARDLRSLDPHMSRDSQGSKILERGDGGSAPGAFRLFADLVRFEHTIFALPFAYFGLFLGARGLPGWRLFLLVTLAMVGARTAAMAFNRIVDRTIDARNPRTKNRPLPAGKMKLSTAAMIFIAGVLILDGSAFFLNRLALQLTPVALVLVCGYSYMKRFTSLCHIVLGLCLAAAPVGGYIAATGTISFSVLLVALAVTTWVAGFDIIYATMDEDFDRREGLHSAVVRLGLERALSATAGLHMLTLATFAVAGLVGGLGIFYFLGVLFSVPVVIREHSLARSRNAAAINAAFFQANAIISVLISVGGMIDLIR